MQCSAGVKLIYIKCAVTGAGVITIKSLKLKLSLVSNMGWPGQT